MIKNTILSMLFIQFSFGNIAEGSLNYFKIKLKGVPSTHAKNPSVIHQSILVIKKLEVLMLQVNHMIQIEVHFFFVVEGKICFLNAGMHSLDVMFLHEPFSHFDISNTAIQHLLNTTTSLVCCLNDFQSWTNKQIWH